MRAAASAAPTEPGVTKTAGVPSTFEGAPAPFICSASLDAIKMARDAWPKRWTNVKVRFFVEEMMLAFFCDDKSIGELQVTVLDSDGEKIAYLEGTNHHTADCTVGFNLRGLPAELLAECFHMVRCFREFERTDNLDYANGFDYFRSRAVREWQSWILR